MCDNRDEEPEGKHLLSRSLFQLTEEESKECPHLGQYRFFLLKYYFGYSDWTLSKEIAIDKLIVCEQSIFWVIYW